MLKGLLVCNSWFRCVAHSNHLRSHRTHHPYNHDYQDLGSTCFVFSLSFAGGGGFWAIFFPLDSLTGARPGLGSNIRVSLENCLLTISLREAFLALRPLCNLRPRKLAHEHNSFCFCRRVDICHVFGRLQGDTAPILGYSRGQLNLGNSSDAAFTPY